MTVEGVKEYTNTIMKFESLPFWQADTLVRNIPAETNEVGYKIESRITLLFMPPHLTRFWVILHSSTFYESTPYYNLAPFYSVFLSSQFELHVRPVGLCT